jgi:hypothetical protein
MLCVMFEDDGNEIISLMTLIHVPRYFRLDIYDTCSLSTFCGLLYCFFTKFSK